MDKTDGCGIPAAVRSQTDGIRMELERQGYSLTDGEYESLLRYADRKRILAGKEPSYLPLLMEDEIRQKCFRDALNAVSAGMFALA